MTMKVDMPDGEPLSTRVTKIDKKWHCRLMCLGEVHSEMACSDQRDIGYCFHELLRWYDKMSYEPFSNMAYASRHRQKSIPVHGKIDHSNKFK